MEGGRAQGAAAAGGVDGGGGAAPPSLADVLAKPTDAVGEGDFNMREEEVVEGACVRACVRACAPKGWRRVGAPWQPGRRHSVGGRARGHSCSCSCGGGGGKPTHTARRMPLRRRVLTRDASPR